MGTLYKITNLRNGKCYIGQTIFSIDHRWRAHQSSARQGSKWRFHGAIRKYGPDAFKPEVIIESDDMNMIKREEAKLIEMLDLTNNKKGYNSTPGGCGGDIVKSHNRKKWLNNLSIALKGSNNPRFNGVSNEDLYELALKTWEIDGRLPSPARLREHGKKTGINVPKFFTKYRDWKGMIKKLEEKTGDKYDPYWHQRNRGKNG